MLFEAEYIMTNSFSTLTVKHEILRIQILSAFSIFVHKINKVVFVYFTISIRIRFCNNELSVFFASCAGFP